MYTKSMHRVKRLLGVFVLYIGTFCSVLNADVEEPDVETLIRNKMVFVEPTNVTVGKVNEEWKLLPYLQRRGHWGATFSVGFCAYQPYNYEPNFSNHSYKEVYGQPPA